MGNGIFHFQSDGTPHFQITKPNLYTRGTNHRLVGALMSSKGCSSVLREPASIDGQWNRLQLFKLVSQGGYTEKPNTRGIDKDSKKKSAKNSLESPRDLVINVFV